MYCVFARLTVQVAPLLVDTLVTTLARALAVLRRKADGSGHGGVQVKDVHEKVSALGTDDTVGSWVLIVWVSSLQGYTTHFILLWKCTNLS